MKPTYKFRLLLLSMLIFIPEIIWSQDPKVTFKNQMNTLFQYVDKAKITSGLLSDYAFESVEVAPFNGIPSDTNYVNSSTWINLYSSIYDAKINNLISLETPDVVAGKFVNAAVTGNAIPLAIMHYQYDKLDNDALNKGWLSYANGQIRNVAGKPSPYLRKNLFAVAPQNLIFEAKTVVFTFKSDLFFRNNTKSVSKLEINFNNQSGYKIASWNTPVSYTFSSSGEKTIYYRVTYTDGTSYLSRTKIYIKESVSTLRAGEDSVTIKKSGLHSGGKLEIRYSLNNNTQTLKKPLIIAEPFDMSSILSIATNYNLNHILSQAGPVQQILEDFLEYDIVYLNYNNGMDDIFRNAALFKEAVKWVNTNKASGATPNVVLGVSMGGLVARYALRSMEIEGLNHDTWKYISLDAPHKGANLPLGLQGMIRDIQSFAVAIFGLKVLDASKVIPILDQLYGVLDAKASRQMLIYYCNKNMVIDNSEHEAFQQEYDRVGFPLNCQNIAVSCGSGQGTTLFAPGTRLFSYSPQQTFNWLESYGVMIASFFTAGFSVTAGDVNPLTSFKMGLMNTIPGNSAIKSDFIINALPDRKVAKVYDGHVYYQKKNLWVIPVSTDISRRSLSSKADMLPLDGAAGSFTGFAGVNSDNENFQEILKRFDQPSFTFVPTPSSLALSNWKNLINKDIRSRDFFAEGLTEFEQYACAPTTSAQHCIFPHAATFFAQQLAAPLIYFESRSPVFCAATTVKLKNPVNISINWSVSSGFSLSDKKNISTNVGTNQMGLTGALTANYTTSISKPWAASLGLSSFPVQVRKRLQSTTCNTSSIAISGPANICPNSSGIFTILNFTGPVTWSCSHDLELSVDGNTAIVTNNKSTCKSILRLNSVNNVDEMAVYSAEDVQFVNAPPNPVQVPCPLSISYVRASIPGTSISVEKSVITDCACIFGFDVLPDPYLLPGFRKLLRPLTGPPAEISWSLPSGVRIEQYNSQTYLCFFPTSGTYLITAYATNECSTASFSKGVSVGTGGSLIYNSDMPAENFDIADSFVSTFPNPVSNVLNIKFADSEIVTQTAVYSELPHKSIEVILYDIYGVPLRSTVSNGENVWFDTSNLKDGFYYLHIFDKTEGGSIPPVKQQIIVRH